MMSTDFTKMTSEVDGSTASGDLASEANKELTSALCVTLFKRFELVDSVSETFNVCCSSLESSSNNEIARVDGWWGSSSWSDLDFLDDLDWDMNWNMNWSSWNIG